MNPAIEQIHGFNYHPGSRKNLELPTNNLGNCYMDSKISWLTKQKTFAVSYTIYGIGGTDASNGWRSTPIGRPGTKEQNRGTDTLN